MNIHEQRIVPPSNPEEYFVMRLERAFEQGKTVEYLVPEFEHYGISPADRHRYILMSPFGQVDEVRGTVELFGNRQ